MLMWVWEESVDHLKQALKNKMKKHAITIEIAVKPHEEDKDTDLAPEVNDSDEPGVDKGELDLGGLVDKMPEGHGGIHDKAKQLMLAKLKAKKGLKV